jgi:hypothetical protein
MELPLEPVARTQMIRGVPFAAGVSFRQLVITGPPGVGKTTLVTKIGGWPEEGFVDLTQRNWWRSRVLAFRPRQIHLGLPFAGHPIALTTFEREWLDRPDRPALETERIQLPPLGSRRSPWKHRRKYVFDFLLPPVEKVLAARLQRSDRRSHLIDTGVTLEQVGCQLEVYGQVARFLHGAGFAIFVRTDFGAPPSQIAEEVADPGIEAARPRLVATTGGRSWLHHYVRQFTKEGGDRIADRSRRAHLAGSRALVDRGILPVEIRSGEHTIRVYPETGAAAVQLWPQAVRVIDTDRYFSGIADFHRLAAGQSIRIGRKESGAPADSEDRVFPRIEISNDGDTIAVADLESDTGTAVVPLSEETEITRLERDRRTRLERIAAILGGIPPRYDTPTAIRLLREAITAIEESEWQPTDARGRPGGLVELPDHFTPVIVGDLHANLDNLLIVMSEGRFLDALDDGTAAFILLGDAVHREEGADLREMETSITTMDAIIAFMAKFANRFIYVRGNHDSFSPDVTKEGIPQGKLWRDTVRRVRGNEYATLLGTLYASLPYVVAGNGFIACHAGPPMEAVTREKIVDVHKYPRLMYQLTWSRIQSPRNPGGYGKRDVRSFQKAFGMKKRMPVIVSHNPREGEDTAVVELGGIKGHHLVYSAKADRVSVFTRVGGSMVPLTWAGGSVGEVAAPVP